ncbi:sugar MFS transporter [Chryseobacterium sp. SNU WT5]|uniref:MFS transporter n=1 Tax=Chryseobacterium sp. SNU WT5 TaxID=2594269 RepID=UPI0011810A03|nr:MFS transporter [Chryseobacterium sp. SNU WT5]QDP84633.1 sugar MFS transporter [Chryseobacterium sp. SNU WT5]
MTETQQKTNYPALYTLITVFFFWGFVAASNGILIPFCKTHFSLTNFESQLLGSSFFGAYFIGSLILYLASTFLKFDIINKIGYKNSIITGLVISIIGALIMIPSTNANSFSMMLLSLFIVALGFSLQQTAAQPFALALGSPSTGAHRLNLAGGLNSFGTTIGPIIVSYFLFGSLTSNIAPSPSNINTLYIILASVFALVAIIFIFSKLPSGKTDEDLENSPKATKSLVFMTLAILGIIALGNFTEVSKVILLVITIVAIIAILVTSNKMSIKNSEGWGAMKFPQLVYGMIAIFFYVGVEVTIDNNFGSLLKTPGYLTANGLAESEISKYISLYWGSLMIGRWMGAISVFNLKKTTKLIATFVVPFIAFVVIIISNNLKGTDMSDLYAYSICIIITIAAFIYANEKPVRLMITVSTLAIIAMVIGIFTTGIVSVYAFIAGGLFCSVMWPCIFSLATTGLGKFTSQGSAFLIMMILGGAIIPPFQGAIGDTNLGIHFSYIIAAICFVLLLVLTFLMTRSLKNQGIDLDQVESQTEPQVEI